MQHQQQQSQPWQAYQPHIILLPALSHAFGHVRQSRINIAERIFEIRDPRSEQSETVSLELGFEASA